ncbi:MAG: LamG-like jellyroll fold domain-containing protein [Cyclobacterium sp.]|uniref:LamG-like jellyroll fold domain-containing protein n=1 Tax=Cyclobacterium sp. TaxID=1966343 RepID=UPI0039710D4F
MTHKWISLVVVLALGLTACTDGYIDDIEFVEPGADNESPEITVNYPTDGTQIRVTEEVTSIEIDLEVEDDIEIESVVVELDGQEIARFEDFKDYRRFLNTFSYDNLTNGEHQLEVIARDLSGKETTTAVVFEKIEPYQPIYENEVFYLPFDGDYTELVRIQNANVSGSPGFTSGISGRAYSGSPDAYLTYEAENLQTEEFSAVFWYKLDGTPDRAGLLVMGPPDEANPTATNNRTSGFRLFRENAGGMQRFKLNVGNGSGENWFDGGAAADIDPAIDAWNHIAFTIASEECTVYINGEVVSQGSFPGIDWSGCDILSVASGAPRFAGWGHLSTSSEMDELRIFDRAISQSEIQSLMMEEAN